MNKAAEIPAEAEEVAIVQKPRNPMAKIILIALALLAILFVYHVLADRYTPYTSQAGSKAS